MTRRTAATLATALAAASCTASAPPPGVGAAYTVGAPYQARGVWRYPEERAFYDATGLAVARAGRPALTADGERYDGDAMAGAHPTLPLPSVVRVTNLDAGRQALIRLNDRGPDDPGRLIALTPRAAAVLGIPPGGTARVRVQLEAEPTAALRESLGAGPRGGAAPLAAVTAETLAAPGVPAARDPARILGEGRAAPTAAPPAALPAAATPVPPQPGALWLDLGEFHDPRYARERAAELAVLGARIEQEGAGRAALFRVRAGPFATVADADNAVDQARRAGVSDAAITAQ